MRHRAFLPSKNRDILHKREKLHLDYDAALCVVICFLFLYHLDICRPPDSFEHHMRATLFSVHDFICSQSHSFHCGT